MRTASLYGEQLASKLDRLQHGAASAADVAQQQVKVMARVLHKAGQCTVHIVKPPR
jgi:hypothetical protein